MGDVSAYGAFRHRTEAVFLGYVECGLWSESCQGTATAFHSDPSSCHGDDCDSSLSHDLKFSHEDLSADAARDMEADVEGFIKSCLEERPDCFDRMDDDQIGHDFWLTRNGHGAGFWDRGLGELGDFLTKMSKPFGEAHLYVNNNGEVECES